MEEGLQKLNQNDMKSTQKIRRMRITLSKVNQDSAKNALKMCKKMRVDSTPKCSNSNKVTQNMLKKYTKYCI